MKLSLHHEGGRPAIHDYRAVATFVKERIHWRKKNDASFSIRAATARLARCSPALVTQVMNGKRRLTPERVSDFASLLDLSAGERTFLQRWVQSETQTDHKTSVLPRKNRSAPQNHLLNDWLNVYVKDAVRLKGFQPDPMVIHRLLGGMASPKRIEKVLSHLCAQGFLRRTLAGNLVENEILETSTDEISSAKIQKFHCQALKIAQNAALTVPTEQRQMSALVLPLNPDSYDELKRMMKEFYEKLLAFAEDHPKDDDRLYQVVVNLIPVGGACE